MTATRPARESLLRWRHGVRPRVVVAYVALLAVALLIANVAVRQVLHSRLDQAVESALVQEAEELRALAGGTDPETGEAFGDDVRAIFDTFLQRNVPGDDEAFYAFVDGDPILRSFEAPSELMAHPEVRTAVATATDPVRFDLDTTLGEVRFLVVPLVADGTDGTDEVLGSFVVAFLMANEQAEIDQAVGLVAVVSLVVLGLSSLVAWGLAGRVLRPVARLTETAARITDTDLSERIPVEGHDELARLTATFNEMLERLEDAATAQRQFLDDIAHDLRTPLTIVRGHLEMLDDDPRERAATIELVQDELDRMSRYVNDLLLLAKAEQPDFLHLGLVDLGEWASDLRDKTQHLGGARVVVDAPSPGEVVVEADAERLTQATLNLVVNAVEYTEPHDEVRLDVGCDDGSVLVTVIDAGPGIEPELLEGLWDRATRGARGRVERREGTGLGLAIVRAIAEAHHGSVAVESEPGSGAAFTITIPTDPSGWLHEEEQR